MKSGLQSGPLVPLLGKVKVDVEFCVQQPFLWSSEAVNWGWFSMSKGLSSDKSEVLFLLIWFQVAKFLTVSDFRELLSLQLHNCGRQVCVIPAQWKAGLIFSIKQIFHFSSKSYTGSFFSWQIKSTCRSPCSAGNWNMYKIQKNRYALQSTWKCYTQLKYSLATCGLFTSSISKTCNYGYLHSSYWKTWQCNSLTISSTS